jgi:hypothetical protein
MLRDYISLTLGVLTLLIASSAVYGILTINTQIQAKPEQTKIPDYSAELDSLKSQVSSMNSQIGSMSSQLSSMDNSLSTLDTMKNSLTDVSAKLLVLEKNSNQISSGQISNSLLSVILDKSVYLQGDTIKIAAVGAVPLKAMQVELIDSTGYVVINSQTYADSAGKISSGIQIPSSQLAGSYQVKLVSDQQVTSTPITIQSGTSSTTTFTAQTDKSTYYTNDLAQISGTGVPNTAVTGIFTSASGSTATSGATVNADGTWTMFFQILPSYQTGTWTITLTNTGQTKSLSMYVSSGSSTTFTAQPTQSIYTRGTTIQVTGTAQASTIVNGVLTSPSGTTYSASSTAQSDGTYSVFFPTTTSYQTGSWMITVTNSAQSKVLYVLLQ